MEFEVCPFVNGDWSALSLVQLTAILDQRYAYRGVTFSFRTENTGAVTLLASKKQTHDIYQDLRMYVQGFFDGWSIANGG